MNDTKTDPKDIIDAAMQEAEPTISYAASFQNPLKRKVVRLIELLSGQPEVKKRYFEYRNFASGDENFLDGCVRLLELDVQFDKERLAEIPKTGPLVVVANHPFGVLDGIVICWLVSQVRDDFQCLTNHVLEGAPEARKYILPIDFTPTKEAQRKNLQTRKTALENLAKGECIIIFPAGAVATSLTPLSRTAIDDDWKPFTARLISQSKAHVTPMYFEGQNSMIFQLASQFSYQLRASLLFYELKRRIGKTMPVKIGETLSPDTLEGLGKRDSLMRSLREITYDMAPAKFQKRLEALEKKLAKGVKAKTLR